MDESLNTANLKRHVRIYMVVFVALAILTIVTVSVAHLHLPILPALVIALFIATIKSSLVASYFMHLISERRVIFSFLMLTLIFLLSMFLLITSSFYDQQGGYLVP